MAPPSPRPVFVHGNPETAAIWRPLQQALAGVGVTDTVALSPPGFGSPVPDGFGATAAAYGDWLAAELEALGAPDRPVDLVGHDWGAGHVFRLVADRPELVRSWIADVGGLLHPDYVWHDAAQGWRTQGVGEEMVAAMVAMPAADLAAAYVGLGMTADIAADCAEAMNEDMAAAVLALYRSAPEPELQALAGRVATAQSSAAGRPGAVVHAELDHYVPPELGRGVTASLRGEGADVIDLDLAGVGHWWMIERPDAAAAAMSRFWADALA